jgi:signal transduction histidine kinase
MINESINDTFFNDPNRTKQLFINFISNANKFTENGQIIIKIEDYQDYLSIVVQDSGVGMNPRILEMISQDVITHSTSEN